jgi:hypothetical protein
VLRLYLPRLVLVLLLLVLVLVLVLVPVAIRLPSMQNLWRCPRSNTLLLRSAAAFAL